MKEYPTYSVTIRTLGTAGEKYAATLRAIDSQTVRPQEIVVVIPYGYDLPQERIGNERFVRSKKGMVRQRAVGFREIKSEYTLALDDDVDFPEDFVERLFKSSSLSNADFVSPRVVLKGERDNTQIPRGIIGGGKKLFSNALNWVMGINYVTKDNDGFAIRIAPTGGFVSKKGINFDLPSPTQSGHGTICFGRTKSLKELDFESEQWLEDTGYALPDDQVMFYKLYLRDNALVYDPSIKIIHLDAGTSIMSDRKLKNIYASSRNGVIFWHRFIFKLSAKKISVSLAFGRRVFFSLFSALIKGLCHYDLSFFHTYLNGYKDGYKFISSKEYKSLPRVK